MKKISKVSLAAVLAVALSLCLAGSASAASPARVYLGAADHFAILGAAAITDVQSAPGVGSSAILAGDVGGYPIDGAAIGIHLAQLTTPGIIYDRDGNYPGPHSPVEPRVITDDVLLSNAWLAMDAAYKDADGRAVTTDLTGQDLGGMTLYPGVYHFAVGAHLNGVLTLDAHGEANPYWIFQTETTLVTQAGAPNEPAAQVVLIGATPCDVFWQVGSSATIGTYSEFVGNIVADQMIALNTGAKLQGTAQTRVAGITLDYATITKGPCALAPPMPYTGKGPDASTIRWSIALLATAILAGIFGVSFMLRSYRRKKVTN
jgi:hypothetical protein